MQDGSGSKAFDLCVLQAPFSVRT